MRDGIRITSLGRPHDFCGHVGGHVSRARPGGSPGADPPEEIDHFPTRHPMRCGEIASPTPVAALGQPIIRMFTIFCFSLYVSFFCFLSILLFMIQI
jgi:hypothetical protein